MPYAAAVCPYAGALRRHRASPARGSRLAQGGRNGVGVWGRAVGLGAWLPMVGSHLLVAEHTNALHFLIRVNVSSHNVAWSHAGLVIRVFDYPT